MMLPMLMLALLVPPLALTMLLAQGARDAGARVADLGVVFAWIVFLYAFLPVLGIWLAGLGLGELADQRLGGLPDTELVVAVGSSYAAFMFAFGCAYALQRVHATIPVAAVQVPSARDLRSIVLLVLAIKAGVLLLRFLLNADAGDDYISSYTALRGQSLFVQQVAGVLGAVDFAATVLVIVTAIAYAPRLHRWVAALVLLQILLAFALGGSRTSAFLGAFAYLVARTVYERRLRPATLALYALAGVGIFLFAGLVRAGFDADEGPLALQLVQGGEFVAVFYNSLDLLDRLGHAGLPDAQIGLYLVDLLRLVPQQIVGDFKIDPAAFYVRTFYPEYGEAGGGFAFGAIAESTLGFGWPEALVRGALLGALYAWVANACLNRELTVVRAFVYTWFVVMSYQAIRDTTFSAFPRFLMQVLPLLLLLRLSGTLRVPKPA